jgi:nitrogen fixation/metabolism regulation signal transduction histidine kinase
VGYGSAAVSGLELLLRRDGHRGGVGGALRAIDARAQSPAPLLSEAQRVAEQFELLHSRFWPVVFVVSLLLIVHGVFFSHRIAGPLYRFRRIFQSVASGDLTVRTSIRKSDYLHVEAQCLG